MNQPKITVIIPIYNVQNYLAECIDSVVSQTYKNLEILLIDDGSTDKSCEICDSYAKKYSYITVFHKKNEGLGVARNYGLSNMTGEYVMFLDSDDYLSYDTIEILYTTMIENMTDICKSGFTRITNNRKIYDKKQYQQRVYLDSNSVRKEFLPRFFGSSPTSKDGVEMSVCGTLYKSSIIKENHLKFVSERELISEDIFFNIEYLVNTNSACITSHTGYFYRYNQQSLTRKYKKDRFKKNKHLYNTLIKTIQKYGYSKQEILRLSRQFFVNIRCCIAQESQKKSSLSKKDIKKHILRICDDETVQTAIDEYPINLLGAKQALFLKLLKNKNVNIIYLMMNLGLIHE